MFKKIRWTSLVILAFSLVFSPTGQAQSTTGTITGTVTDQRNAVVVGAEVTLTNTLTGLVKTGASNRSGQYVLDFIPVGHYTLQVSDPGFSPEVRNDIEISAAQGVQINFLLHVQSSNQSVTVTSETPVVSVGTSSLNLTLSKT